MSSINTFYQNVRGLRSKTMSFKLGLMSNNWDIVAITETWLNESIVSAKLFPPRYSVQTGQTSTAYTNIFTKYQKGIDGVFHQNYNLLIF